MFATPRSNFLNEAPANFCLGSDTTALTVVFGLDLGLLEMKPRRAGHVRREEPGADGNVDAVFADRYEYVRKGQANLLSSLIQTHVEGERCQDLQFAICCPADEVGHLPCAAKGRTAKGCCKRIEHSPGSAADAVSASGLNLPAPVISTTSG